MMLALHSAKPIPEYDSSKVKHWGTAKAEARRMTGAGFALTKSPRCQNAPGCPLRTRLVQSLKPGDWAASEKWGAFGPNADQTRCRSWVKRRNTRCEQMFSALALPAQPVDATQALNLSAGVSNCKVS